MHVKIHEAGEHGHALRVDDLGAGGNVDFAGRTHRDDAVSLDDDGCVMDGRSLVSVQKHPAHQGHGTRPILRAGCPWGDDA